MGKFWCPFSRSYCPFSRSRLYIIFHIFGGHCGCDLAGGFAILAGIQNNYRQTFTLRAIDFQLQIQDCVASRLSFVTDTDLWEYWQRISHYSYRISLEFYVFPWQIQFSCAKCINSVIVLVATVLCEIEQKHTRKKKRSISNDRISCFACACAMYATVCHRVISLKSNNPQQKNTQKKAFEELFRGHRNNSA